jgi:ribA/ribD-fused uncharacterized protein
MKITSTHIYFWKGFLSQWFKSHMVDDNRIIYNCCEQYMMYQKALLFKDFEIAAKIIRSESPKDQKDLGRSVKGFNEERWMKLREAIVERANILKFMQNDDLKKQLIETGDRIIVEATPVDCIWGVGLDEDDPRILDEKNWRGLNLLGKSLMNVRARLNNEK